MVRFRRTDAIVSPYPEDTATRRALVRLLH